MAFVVFAGQSNMGGPYMDSSNVPTAWHADPLTLIWNDSTQAFEQMNPGVNTGFGGDYAGTWGPEVQFAIDFRAAHPGETLYIVKEVDGGTALAVHTGDWNYDWSPNSPNELFDRTTAKVAAASAALGGVHPDTVFWGQGEEDATSSADASAYGDNLAAFFADVRADWMHDANGKIALFKIDTTTSFADQVRAGEQRVDDAQANTLSFDTVGFPVQSDNLHYTAQGYVDIGDGFFQAYQSLHATSSGGAGGGATGQVLTSSTYGDHLTGGAGADTLNAGQGPDVLTGGAGADAFVYKALPWNAGHVTDFVVGTDRLDLSALFSASGYSGSDPIADHYITLQSDGAGGVQVLYDTDGAGGGDTIQYLIATLDHVAAGGLTWAQLATGGSSAGGGGSGDSGGNGSGGDTTPGQVLTSAAYGDHLSGGAGPDTLNAGQGPDVLTGGAGADTFAFKNLPWNAGHVTDFVLGTDKLDLSALFAASGYTGSNPIADHYVTLQSDGSGGTQVLYDTDGSASGNTIQYLITDLDHVATTGLTWAQLSTGGSTSTSGGTTGGGGSSGGGGSGSGSGSPGASGQVLTSSTYGDHLNGGAGADTLIAGQGPDVLTGGGGADHFVFQNLPWNAGHITDFTPGVDVLDLRSLFQSAGYRGADPIADHLLTFQADGAGNTQVLFDADGAGGDWPTTLTTLDHVTPAQIHAGDFLFR